MKNTIVTIFGGTGFIGSQIVRVLAGEGYILRLAEQQPLKANRLKFNGMVGQIQPYACDYSDKAIQDVIKGSTFVVNCTGILAEKARRTFMHTHCEIPEMIAKACAKENVKQFVHISALGIDSNQSKYAQSKLAGEKAIQKAFPHSTILRPSIVFGAEDSFFNKFASMAQILPSLPLIGGGKTQFQPVYVGDVADAISKAFSRNIVGVYELGGPDVMTFKSLLEKMISYTSQNVRLTVLPFWKARMFAAAMRLLPNPPLTQDQITSLKTDNVVGMNAKTLTDFNVRPTSMDAILPHYLERYK